jgi:large subunit ribosomal protein L31
MKAGIHPKYVECKVTCACGSAFTTRSVRSEVRTDICADCHPFFTGAQKFVDTAGRVDKFRKRYAKVQAASESASRAKSES